MKSQIGKLECLNVLTYTRVMSTVFCTCEHFEFFECMLHQWIKDERVGANFCSLTSTTRCVSALAQFAE